MLASLNNFMTQARKAEFMKLGIQPQKGKFFNLEKLQAYSEMTCKLNKKTLALKRLFNEESKNPKVVQIEKELVEKYGIKRACLNDDLNQAEAVLEAVKTVKANGYPLADEYLVTKFCGGTLGEFMRIDNENIVILSSSEYVNSLKKFHDFYHQHLLGSFLERMHYSKNAGLESKVNELDEFFKNNKTPGSDSLLWTAVHETLHIGERSFLPTRTRKVPKEFIPAAMNTTRYAYLSNTQELFTELLSDKLINKNLSPEKEALLKFFNNGDR